MKLFAKIFDNEDACRCGLCACVHSRDGLLFTGMLCTSCVSGILFLFSTFVQKVSSPVLPVLQEMHSLGTANAENLVDGMPGWSVSSEWIK